jgi:hypothetical protein
LETGALPIELLAYAAAAMADGKGLMDMVDLAAIIHDHKP